MRVGNVVHPTPAFPCHSARSDDSLLPCPPDTHSHPCSRSSYVLSLCSTLDGRTIAAAASTSVIKLYDAETMAYEGQVNGHTSRVNQMIGSAIEP